METLGYNFLCTKDLVFGADVIYQKGKIYRSEVEGCITNEMGEKQHSWISKEGDDGYWKTYFRLLKSNKRHGKT